MDAVNERDFPMILGCVITFALCFSLINLAVDLLYVVIDPRIRSQFSGENRARKARAKAKAKAQG